MAIRQRLNGTVMKDDDARVYRWFGYNDVCCPNDVRAAIEQCPEDEELVFEMNSSGGSVYAGFEMYSMIRNSGKNVTAEIQSIAGSAMSVIASACGKVLMSPVANIMIHRSSIGYTGGNSEQLQQGAQMLDTIDESILNAYVEKVGDKTSRPELKHMMEKETFLTAQESIACGLADGLLELPEAKPTLPDAAVAYCGNAASKLPPIDDLKRIMMERSKGNSSEPENSVAENSLNEVQEETTMEYETKGQLMEAYPNLIAEIQEEARAAERERIAEIDAVAMPGFEDIIAAAKADPKQNAGSVALEMIAKQKKQGQIHLAGLEADAESSKANVVAGVPAPVIGVSPETEAAATARTDVEEWKKRGNK